MTTPVLLLGFNRPDKMRRVIEPLRIAKPPRVFISVDGPRADRPEEADKCLETQRTAEAAIDWPCEITKLYQPTNLGCRRAVSSAISAAFQQVEELIIIEDDCVLDPSFFTFCDTLLKRYQKDEQFVCISADNFQQGQRHGDGDYYVSKYHHCWGWATWKRAWLHYQDDLEELRPAVEEPAATKLHASEDERAYWQIIYQRCCKGEVDSWAYRWLFSCWLREGWCLLPNQNLVTNIGFDEEATHTSTGGSPLRMVQPLLRFDPPSSLARATEADAFTFNTIFCPPLSSAKAQVSQHRIRQLKASLKDALAELDHAKKQLAAGLSQRPWWRKFLGLK